MKLKKLLFEITVDQALKVLDFSKSDLGDEGKLKLAFRKAALVSHPDKGGSNEAMRDVNDAYELLKKQTSQQHSFDDYKRQADERRNNDKEIANKILESLKSKINYSAFVKYFNSVYNEIFVHRIFNERPSSSSYYISYAGLTVEFSNPDRSIVFILELSASVSDATSSSSLGSGVGNVSYPLGVEAYGFYNNKKLKITQRDYNRTTNHDVLDTPDLSFPKAKLEKFKGTSVTKVFKKADMLTYLTNKLRMTWDGEDARIRDLPPTLSIVFRRITMLRTPVWDLYFFENRRGVPGVKSSSFPETIETAQKIEDLVKKVAKTDDVSEIKSIVIKWSNTVKGFGD